MPLHGKIVVIKRSGADGTEFPLTASCLFGRKPDCDIRIQLPEVSKEHCRIDFNENKEIILTNLSTVNPTRVNGEALQQSERLKHGDVITIIDRSFRFEYPPAPTPKKRSCTGGKSETLKVLQDQQVGDFEKGDKRNSEVSTDPHLKDGTNHDNIQKSMEKTLEAESKLDDSQQQSKTASPFNDLYQMIKKSLDVKTPRKSSASVPQTPVSRFCTPKPASFRKSDGKPAISTGENSAPSKNEAQVPPAADGVKVEAENKTGGTPKSVKKQRRSSLTPKSTPGPQAENSAQSEMTSPQKRIRTPPQRFTAGEVVEQICSGSPKSPARRRSKEGTPVKPAAASPKADGTPKASPRNSRTEIKENSKKRKSGELPADLPKSQMKRKRVSFGGHLSPELFDKRLPPDSPLRKGAAPRRSLGLLKPKQSLLRRASVIGLLTEAEQEQPESPKVQSAKMKTPSPKKSTTPKSASPKTPTPAKKSPKSKSPSPKAATPAKASPKSKPASPKAQTPAKKSLKSKTPSPQAATPANKTPKSKSPSADKIETPKSAKQTPSVQGRFSVSRISTPSPIADDAVTNATPKLSAKRKSIIRKTPKLTKSAVKLMARRSGISRASLKAKSSFADIVKFGKAKTQVVAPTKKTVVMKRKKREAVTKPQTPAKALPGYFSTGHACSPVTIVVSRAQKQKLVQPTGAAPRVVTNTAVLKKNMKMDEDLTGVSEMFKTPVNERKRRSVIGESSAMKTPKGGLETPLIEPSVLNTPEEPGEMMVSPLSVSSSVKDRQYNSEAVKRLLDGDEEPSFNSGVPAIETDDSTEQECTDTKSMSVLTPKQKPELPDCLTGVKRVMKTPKQKSEPIEDLRGRLLKTPKQKLEQQECLTGVKRIMKTPKQKNEPIEDLRGKILKTPKQKPEEQECLSGVKRIMKTPRQKNEPIEDLRGKILKTPKQKPEEQECLSGVKRIMKTPRQKAEAVEDIRGNLLKTPKQKLEQLECLSGVKSMMQTPQQEAKPLEDLKVKLLETPEAPEAGDAGQDVVGELTETPIDMQESENVSEMKTPKVKSSPPVCLTGIKRIMKTPKEKSEAVRESFGIQRLMETPRVSAPVEDTVCEPADDQDTEQVEDQPPVCTEVAKELEFSPEEMQKDSPTDAIDDVPLVGMEKEEALLEEPSQQALNENAKDETEATGTVSDAAAEESQSEEQPTVDAVDEIQPEEQPDLEAVEMETAEAPESLSEAEEAACIAAETKATTEDPEPQAPETESLPEEKEATCSATETEATTEESEPQAPVSKGVPDVEEATCSITEMETTAEDPGSQATVTERSPEVGEETCVVTEIETTSPDPEPEPQAPETESLPEVEEATCSVSEAPVLKKPARGRRAKTVEAKAAEDKQETPEQTEEPTVPAPVRGRRGKKTEAPEAPAVRQTTRGRNTKAAESTVVQLVEEKSEPPSSEVAVKPKRGRNARKAADVPENVPEVANQAEIVPQCEQSPAPEEDQEAAPVELAVAKPKRGRRAKQAEPEKKDDDPTPDDVSKTEVAEEVSEQLEVVLSEEGESKSSDAVEAVSESVPEMEAEAIKDTVTEAAVVQKKPARGRKAKTVESKVEQTQEATEQPEDPVVVAPVRGRRGRKVEAAAPAVSRQKTRGRNAKSQESTPEEQPEELPEKSVEMIPEVTEVSSESVSEPTSPTDTLQEEKDSAPPTEEAVMKPVRGRRTKRALVEQPEPTKNEVPCDEQQTAEAEPQKSEPTVEKPKRGRKVRADTVKQNEEAEDTVATVETKQPAQPPARAKRGRNARQQKENNETEMSAPAETPECQEPATKVRRTRRAEPNREEQTEVQPEETVIPVEVEAQVVEEPVTVIELSAAAAKPRRGRKPKQDVETPAPVESAEIQEVSSVSATDKPKRGRRGKQVTQEAEVAAVIPEEKPKEAPEAEEPEAPAVKPSRGKAQKTAKTEVSQATPSKRGRRGAAVPQEETNAEPTVVIPEPATTSVAKRGRRAAAKPTTEDAKEDTPAEDSSQSAEEDSKVSKRSVRWKPEPQVIEFPKETPVKVGRGRKSKLAEPVDAEDKTESKEENKPEEEDLSETDVKALPVKRARRGAKVADVTPDEAEAQPKPRRGRTAKK
ncbi:proliferation marker protein Ki-67 isoform X2 [Halichoeres trimaculatus]|uniref:proliferation marker protein Ki-67 isoform X2 n=1 Tax=Halichoeres trimaculatus TaxID=147232 RepID=UPI003D9E4F1F